MGQRGQELLPAREGEEDKITVNGVSRAAKGLEVVQVLEVGVRGGGDVVAPDLVPP